MAVEHRWVFTDESGSETRPDAYARPTFPNRAEAEAWLGEEWQDIAEAGVSSVTLVCGEAVVYGPMSLSA